MSSSSSLSSAAALLSSDGRILYRLDRPRRASGAKTVRFSNHPSALHGGAGESPAAAPVQAPAKLGKPGKPGKLPPKPEDSSRARPRKQSSKARRSRLSLEPSQPLAPGELAALRAHLQAVQQDLQLALGVNNQESGPTAAVSGVSALSGAAERASRPIERNLQVPPPPPASQPVQQQQQSQSQSQPPKQQPPSRSRRSSPSAASTGCQRCATEVAALAELRGRLRALETESLRQAHQAERAERYKQMSLSLRQKLTAARADSQFFQEELRRTADSESELRSRVVVLEQRSVAAETETERLRRKLASEKARSAALAAELEKASGPQQHHNQPHQQQTRNHRSPNDPVTRADEQARRLALQHLAKLEQRQHSFVLEETFNPQGGLQFRTPAPRGQPQPPPPQPSEAQPKLEAAQPTDGERQLIISSFAQLLAILGHREDDAADPHNGATAAAAQSLDLQTLRSIAIAHVLGERQALLQLLSLESARQHGERLLREHIQGLNSRLQKLQASSALLEERAQDLQEQTYSLQEELRAKVEQIALLQGGRPAAAADSGSDAADDSRVQQEEFKHDRIPSGHGKGHGREEDEDEGDWDFRFVVQGTPPPQSGVRILRESPPWDRRRSGAAAAASELAATAELRQTLADLRQQLSAADNARDLALAEAEGLQQRLEELEERLEEALAGLDRQRETTAEGNRQRQDLEAELAQLAQQYEQVSAMVASLQQQLADSQSALESREAELAELRRRAETQATQLAAAQEATSRQQTETQELQSEYDRLLADWEQLGERRNEDLVRAGQLEQALDDLREQLRQPRPEEVARAEELKELQERCGQLEEELTELRAARELALEHAAHQQEALELARQQLETLRAELSRERAASSQAGDEQRLEVLRLQQLEQELRLKAGQLEESRSQLVQRVQQLEKASAQASSELQQERKRCGELKSDLESAVQQRSAVQAQLQMAEHRIWGLQGCLEVQASTVEQGLLGAQLEPEQHAGGDDASLGAPADADFYSAGYGDDNLLLYPEGEDPLEGGAEDGALTPLSLSRAEELLRVLPGGDEHGGDFAGSAAAYSSSLTRTQPRPGGGVRSRLGQ